MLHLLTFDEGALDDQAEAFRNHTHTHTHTRLRAFGVLSLALCLLGLTPTELRAQTFVQYKGAYCWNQTSPTSSWRSSVPVPGALSGDLREVEQESHAYYLSMSGAIFGQGALPTYGSRRPVEELVSGLSGIVDIEAGTGLLLALTTAGEVWSLGEPFRTQVTTALVPSKLTLPPIKQLEFDESVLFALSTSGALYTYQAGTLAVVQTGVRSVALGNDESGTAILKNDGSVFELDPYFRAVPQTIFGLTPEPVRGLPSTIVSLAAAPGLFAAVDVSGDLYVWPRASFSAQAQVPQAVKLLGVTDVAEVQLIRSSGGYTLPSGNVAKSISFTVRTKNRKLLTGKLFGIVPSGSRPAELVIPEQLDLVEHLGEWDGFDRDLGALCAFSRTGADPSGNLSAEVTRQSNDTTGNRKYRVSLKMTGAPDNAAVGFKVLSDHRPAGVSTGDVSYVQLVNGQAVLEYGLTNPRGVFRASAFVDRNGNRQNDSGETVSTVEVK